MGVACSQARPLDAPMEPVHDTQRKQGDEKSDKGERRLRKLVNNADTYTFLHAHRRSETHAYTHTHPPAGTRVHVHRHRQGCPFSLGGRRC